MLVLSEIDKSYGATRAVRNVTLDAAPGTVLGLAGENGAGKSTLIKIVAGVVRPDRGAMSIDGRPIAPGDTNAAIDLGVASVFQELTLVRELTVEENLLISNPPRKFWGALDRRAMRRLTQTILERYRLDIPPQARVGTLPLGQQQMLEIVRAVERQPQVLLLDEATSALGAQEVEWLAGLVSDLRRQGIIVLFISHRWDEIVRFCTRVAILRNGELVHTAAIDAISEDDAIRLMTGQETLTTAFPDKIHSNEPVILSARKLRTRSLRGVSLEIRKGEILGLGGLVGQGQGALLEALFGVEPLESGAIAIGGAPTGPLTPRRAIDLGLAYVPQERKTEGLLLHKSVAVNMTLAILRSLASSLGFVRLELERNLVQEAIASAQIRARGGREPVERLSGGNQQKVLIEKWLKTKPAILLFNDVTRGVDIGTKHHIYRLIAAIARSGVAIIWYSTDARELVGVVHRVLVLLQGRINAELIGDQVTVDRIVRASVVGSALSSDAMDADDAA